MSIDGTKIDAIASWRSDCEAADGGAIGGASKIRSVRYDRARELRAKLARDIAELTAKAEAADADDADPQALPAELARREALKAKLDAACARTEAKAKAEAEAARPAYEAKLAAFGGKTGNRGRAPVPPVKPPRAIAEPWRITMNAKLETANATGNENRASNQCSGSSRARSASSASTCAPSSMSQANGP